MMVRRVGPRDEVEKQQSLSMTLSWSLTKDDLDKNKAMAESRLLRMHDLVVISA
jgi:hypothetical protein